MWEISDANFKEWAEDLPLSPKYHQLHITET